MSSTQTVVLISQLLREDFINLLSELPDELFNLSPEDREPHWQKAYHLAVHGIRDIQILASTVRISLAENQPAPK